MGAFIQRASRFSELTKTTTNIAPLDPVDVELMWLVVDYSALSNIPDGFFETEDISNVNNWCFNVFDVDFRSYLENMSSSVAELSESGPQYLSEAFCLGLN